MAALLPFGVLAGSQGNGVALAAGAGPFPVLMVEKTCRGAPTLLSAQPGGEPTTPQARQELAARTYKTCMASEESARQQAQERWPHVKSENQKICFDLSRSIFPSYVELASCLQMYDPRINAPGDADLLQKSDLKSHALPSMRH
jgi:hypothetical protein